MKILALSTSGRLCSVVLMDGETVLSEDSFYHEMELLKRLTQRIENVLAAAGSDLNHVEAYAVDTGPGSFTGVRIGVMTAKALAWARRAPIAGVSSLEALAQEAPPGTTAVACVRARPGHVYWQAFPGQRGTRALSPARLSRLEECALQVGALSPRAITIVHCDLRSSDHDLLVEEIRRHTDAETATIAAPVRALHVGRLALQRLPRSSEDALTLKPTYIAEPDIGPRSN